LLAYGWVVLLIAFQGGGQEASTTDSALVTVPTYSMNRSAVSMSLQRERTSLSAGPILSWLNLDLSTLNEIIEPFRYAPLKGDVFLFGGMCSCYPARDWQLGGGGFYGETTSRQETKQAALSLELGGLFADYTIWVGRSYALSVGAFAGVGRGTLELLDHQSETFEATLEVPPSILLRRDFWAFQLHTVLSFDVLPWLSVELHGGYLWTFGGRWQQSGRELEGPVANFNGYTVQVVFAFNKGG
jgi:hypothetical protein